MEIYINFYKIGIFNNWPQPQLLKTSMEFSVSLIFYIFFKIFSKNEKFMLKNSIGFGIIYLKYKQNCRCTPYVNIFYQGVGVCIHHIKAVLYTVYCAAQRVQNGFDSVVPV